MENTKRRGIVLMNLGSPDSTAVPDVRRYLMEFLMDGRVIDKPLIFRALLVGGIIVPFRAPKSAEAYKKIWTERGSPLIFLTEDLRTELLRSISAPISIAMRYGNPTVEQAYAAMLEAGVEEVIAVPLYPHYAMSSYETAVEHARSIHRKGAYPFSLEFIKPFYREPDYIDSLVESIRPYIQQKPDHILFSYHGIPERHVQKSDPTGNHCLNRSDCCSVSSPAHATCYRHQCFKTTELLAEALELQPGTYSTSFQSRLGRDEWLKPYTANRLETFPGEGVKKLAVVCPAFVSDCLETIEEIGQEGRESFLHAGGEEFTLIPCLNIQPKWVQTLSDWLGQALEGRREMLLS